MHRATSAGGYSASDRHSGSDFEASFFHAAKSNETIVGPIQHTDVPIRDVLRDVLRDLT